MSPMISEPLAVTRDLFPFPEGELRRTFARQWILDFIPRGGVGAEIGVFRGHFSERILEVNKPRKLYLVDPWTLIGEYFSWSDDYTNFGRLPTSVAKREVELLVNDFPETDSVIIEDSFPTCIARITEPLDWAYVDASHGYQATLGELYALSGILVADGTIIGDDWHSDPSHCHHGVYRAVQEFVRMSDFEIVAAGVAGQWCLKRRSAYEFEPARDVA